MSKNATLYGFTKRQTGKVLGVFLVVLLMIVSIVPFTAFADDSDGNKGSCNHVCGDGFCNENAVVGVPCGNIQTSHIEGCPADCASPEHIFCDGDVHNSACPYMAAEPCDHVCSVESSCLIPELANLEAEEGIEEEPEPITVQVFNEYTTVLTLAAAHYDADIYEGDSFTLEATGLAGAAYLALPGGLAFDEAENNNVTLDEDNGRLVIMPDVEGNADIILKAEIFGSYMLFLRDENGVPIAESLTVDVSFSSGYTAALTLAAAHYDVPICEGESFTLEATGLAGTAYMQLPSGLAFDVAANANVTLDENTQRLVIAPDADGNAAITLKAETSGWYMLFLTDENDAPIAEPLAVPVGSGSVPTAGNSIGVSVFDQPDTNEIDYPGLKQAVEDPMIGTIVLMNDIAMTEDEDLEINRNIRFESDYPEDDPEVIRTISMTSKIMVTADATLEFSNVQLAVPVDGTAKLVASDSVNLVLNGLTYTNGGRGAVTMGTGKLTMTGCVFTGGSVVSGGDVTVESGSITDHYGTENGGGIYADGDVTLVGTEIIGCAANQEGQKVVSGGGIYAKGDVWCTGGQISGNTASLNGGGVYAEGDVTIDGTTFEGNKAEWNSVGASNPSLGNDGGAAVYSEGRITMNGGDIYGNTCITEDGTYWGGGILRALGDITMNGGTISGRAIDGSAIDGVYIGVSTDDDFEMNDGTIEELPLGGAVVAGGDARLHCGTIMSNESPYDDSLQEACAFTGGVWAGGNVTICEDPAFGMYIFNNTGDLYGGVYSGGTTTMKGGEVSGNISEHGTAAAGITAMGGFTMSEGYIIANGDPDSNAAGGVYSEGDIRISGDSQISDNSTAGSGGGVRLEGFDNVSLEIDGAFVTGNVADYGAGIYVKNADITLKNATISDNTAKSFGGGVWQEGSGGVSLEIDGASVTGNFANYGAGIYANGDVTIKVESGSFTGNEAKNGGGAIFLQDLRKLWVKNGVTFSENTAIKGGAPLTEEDVALHKLNIGIPYGEGKFSNSYDFAYNNYDVFYDQDGSTCNVIFNVAANGGKWNLSDMADRRVIVTPPYSTTVGVNMPQNPTKEGHTFKEWNTESNGSGTVFTANTTVSANITVYAIFKVNKHILTYDLNGGTNPTRISPDTVDYGSKIVGAPSYTPSPKKTDHTFDGWYTDNALANRVTDATTMPDYDLTIYAKWVQQFTVTFVNYDGTVLKTQTVDKGDSATPPASPIRDGYTFSGWSGSYINVQKNETVTATYTQNLVPTTPVTPPVVTPPVVTPPDDSSSSSPDDNPTPPVAPTPTDPTPPAGNVSEEVPGYDPRFDEQTNNILEDVLNGRVPLTNFTHPTVWSLLNLGMAIIGTIIALYLLISGFRRRKLKTWDENGEEQTVESDKSRMIPMRIAAIVTGALLPILFLILENMNNPMVWINRWTPLFAIVLVVHIVLNVIQMKYNRRVENGEDTGSGSDQGEGSPVVDVT